MLCVLQPLLPSLYEHYGNAAKIALLHDNVVFSTGSRSRPPSSSRLWSGLDTCKGTEIWISPEMRMSTAGGVTIRMLSTHFNYDWLCTRVNQNLKMCGNSISYIYLITFTIKIEFCEIFSFFGGELNVARRQCMFIWKILCKSFEKCFKHIDIVIKVQTFHPIVKTHSGLGPPR